MGNKHIIPGGYPMFRWTESPAGTRSAFRSCQGSPCPPPATSQELGLSSNIHQLSMIGVGKKVTENWELSHNTWDKKLISPA